MKLLILCILFFPMSLSFACESLDYMGEYKVEDYSCQSIFPNACQAQYKVVHLKSYCVEGSLLVELDFQNGTPLIYLTSKEWQQSQFSFKQLLKVNSNGFESLFYRKNSFDPEGYILGSTWSFNREQKSLRYESKNLKETFLLSFLSDLD